MAVIRVSEGTEGYVLVNLDQITHVECANLKRDINERRANVYFAGGGSMILHGRDAEYLIQAMDKHHGPPVRA